MTSADDSEIADLRALVDEVCAHFVVPEIESLALSKFDVGNTCRVSDLASIADNFKQSVEALISTASMPYSLMFARVRDYHWHHFYSAQKIRTLKSEYEKHSEEKKEEIAIKAAISAFEEFMASERGKRRIVDGVCRALKESLRQGLPPAVASNLLQQCVIIAWTNFEVFCRDMFEALLNREPLHAKRLRDDEAARRRFEIDKISFEILSGNNFDLSGKMGTILVSRNDFSDIATIKDAYFALYPTDRSLRDEMTNRKLWDLCKLRHLLVHRGGQVDERFLATTGKSLQLGSRIQVAPSEFEEYLETAIRTAFQLLKSVCSEQS